MYIIIDTNIYASDFLLRSNRFKLLNEYCSKTCTTIVFPQLVSEELLSLYKKNLKTKYDNAFKALRELNNLLIIPSIPFTPLPLYDDLGKQYIHYFKDTLCKRFIDEPIYKDSYLSEIVNRSIKRMKPFSDKGEEFRDALLWLTIIDYVKFHGRDNHYIFISNNIKDFANQQGDELHQDLLDELTPLTSRFTYYTNLTTFLNDHLTKISYINADWLSSVLDWDYLNGKALTAVEAIDENFFLGYFFNNVSSNIDISNWVVVKAYFTKKVTDFTVGEVTSDKYKVYIDFAGWCIVNFESDSGDIYRQNLNFYVNFFSIVINEGSITEYQDKFHEEETVLADAFPLKNKYNF